jgi:hypothetical protein
MTPINEISSAIESAKCCACSATDDEIPGAGVIVKVQIPSD